MVTQISLRVLTGPDCGRLVFNQQGPVRTLSFKNQAGWWLIVSERNLYVGCGLTQAPAEFKRQVAELKTELRCLGHSVLEFIGDRPATPAEVYTWDIEDCVKQSQAMLALVDYPSLGLGWEMAVAATEEIPTLVVARTDSLVSRLVIGAAECQPLFEFERYSDLADIPEQLSRFLGQLVVADCHSETLF